MLCHNFEYGTKNGVVFKWIEIVKDDDVCIFIINDIVGCAFVY